MQMLPPQMFVNRSWCALGLLGLLSLGASACGTAPEDEPEDAGQVIILEEVEDDDEPDESRDGRDEPAPEEEPDEAPVGPTPDDELDPDELDSEPSKMPDPEQDPVLPEDPEPEVSADPALIAQGRVFEHIGSYAAAVTPAGSIYLIYEHRRTGDLMSTAGDLDQGLASPVVLAEREGGSLDMNFSQLRATASEDGRILASFQTSRMSGHVPHAVFSYSRSYAYYADSFEVGLISTYEFPHPSEDNDSDIWANHDIDFDPTGGFVSMYGHTDAQQIRFERFASNSNTRTALFTPTNHSYNYHVRMGVDGAGHLVYEDPEVNGVVYQYVSPQGEGTIDMSAKLEELEDRPASVSMDIAPDGSLGLHLTRWEDGQTTFIWGAPVVNQNHEVEEFDMLYYDVTAGFGAAPEVHDIVYSSTMGFVVCGQKSDDRLWCQTVSEGAERPLPPTQLSQAPVFTGIRDLTALQLGVSADGTLHVFWTQESAGEGRDLHHAAIR